MSMLSIDTISEDKHLDLSLALKKVSYLALHTYGKKKKYYSVNRKFPDFDNSTEYSSSLAKMVRAAIVKIFIKWEGYTPPSSQLFEIKKLRDRSKYEIRLPIASGNNDSLDLSRFQDRLSILCNFDFSSLEVITTVTEIKELCAGTIGLTETSIKNSMSFCYSAIRIDYSKVYDFEVLFTALEKIEQKIRSLGEQMEIEEQIKKRVGLLVFKLNYKGHSCIQQQEGENDES